MYSGYGGAQDAGELQWKRILERSHAMGLVRKSRNLEHFSMSFFTDADDFFYAFWPWNNGVSFDWKWEKLTTFAHTSKHLNPSQAREKVNDLLEAAGTAAKSMPKLRVMEIWNGKNDSHGCLFRYCTDDTSSTITWKSSWDMELESRVIDCWTKTAYQNTRYENVGIVYEPLPMDGTHFPASVLRHLQLKDKIVHPVSFSQIELLGAPRT